MPSVKPAASTTVLVTGASGFLAVHVVVTALKQGYTVRGTVRSAEKGKYLDELLKKEGLEKNWSWVIVEDLEKEGAFNEAVKGVDAIEHTASPFHFRVEDPYVDLINPAVNGTKALLNAALTEPKVQRVVITSSFASILSPKDGLYTYSEKDWNEFSVGQVEEQGKNVHPGQAYRASKTLAEQAAWDFVKEHTKDGKAPFDIATVNPPLILGPLLHQFSGAKGLNTSVNNWYQFLIGNKADKDAVTIDTQFVDVRDVAQIHVDALSNDAAANQRFVVNNGPLFWQAFLDYVHSDKSLSSAFPDAIKGQPGTKQPESNQLDASKAKKTFGWEPIPWEKTVKDMNESLVERLK
ncbi:D-lactaldehyde dehydrogenase [Pseudohyphozyma bogoriensis]|nr:D-lactaldehyde dehydrogenase [Pseudohyphozyma bogoriensis]